MLLIKKKNFILSSILFLLLIGCNNIERKVDVPLKKLPEIVNIFKTKKIWDKKLVDLTAEQVLNSAIVLANKDQQLISADFSGSVVSIDLNGKILWKQLLKEPITAGPTIFKEQVFVATSTGNLICLNVKDGSLLWTAPLSSEAISAPVVSDDLVFVRTIDGGLSAISLVDHKQLWRLSMVVPSITLRRGAAPVSTEKYLISGFANGKIFALDQQNGSIIWSHNISNPKGRSELQRMTDISADPIIIKDTVYAVSYQGNLAAINLNDGELLWEREISSYSGMVVDQDAIYISTVTGKVLAIDLKTGTTLWIQEGLEGRTLSKPLMLKDYIVVGSNDGNLHFLNRSYGYIKGRIFVHKSGIFIAPLLDNKNNNKLYVLTNNGYLTAIEIIL